ncbi:hypothetical protein BH11PLA2_BH11PLA2_27230 [soil metagenome]
MIVFLEANWLSLILGVMGLASTLIVYKWQKRESIPFYAYSNVVLVNNSESQYPSLQLHYKGRAEDIQIFSSLKIVIWNAGRKTLSGDQIAPSQPITIKAINGTIILGASLLQANNDASQPRLKYIKADNKIDVDFDYLDYLNGFVIEILHTGNSATNIDLTGRFKECGEFTHVFQHYFKYKHKLSRILGRSSLLSYLNQRPIKYSHRSFMYMLGLFVIMTMIFALQFHQCYIGYNAQIVDGIIYREVSTDYHLENDRGKTYARRNVDALLYINIVLLIIMGLQVNDERKKMRRLVPGDLEKFPRNY